MNAIFFLQMHNIYLCLATQAWFLHSLIVIVVVYIIVQAVLDGNI